MPLVNDTPSVDVPVVSNDQKKHVVGDGFVLEVLNLRVLPKPMNCSGQTVILPDSHGNFIKFLHWLLFIGVARLRPSLVKSPQALWDELCTMYVEMCALVFSDQNDQNIQRNDNNLFLQALQDLKIKIERFFSANITFHREAVGRLIDDGDKYGDRGALDNLNFLIHQALLESGVRYSIVLSNHDLDMVKFYFYLKKFYPVSIFISPPEAFYSMEENMAILMPAVERQGGQNSSLINMAQLIKYSAHESSNFLRRVESCYLPRLCLLDVVEIDNALYLVTHAPILKEKLVWACQSLRVKENFSSKKGFIQMVEKLNQAFCRHFTVRRFYKFWAVHYNPSEGSHFSSFVWGREIDDSSWVLDDGTPVYRCFGHTPNTTGVPLVHCVAMDDQNSAGKLMGRPGEKCGLVGPASILCLREVQAPALRKARAVANASASMFYAKNPPPATSENDRLLPEKPKLQQERKRFCCVQ